MKNRNQTIDLLRVIGLFLVIAAHCSLDGLFFELRQFDVVLLVFCSGASFALSSKNEPYKQYVWKRFKRLVLPIWLFLCVFLPIHFYIGQPESLKYVLKTFLFTNGGLMFVWIFRILFIASLCNPFIKKMICKTKHVFLLGLILICINDGLLILAKQHLSSTVLLLYEFIVSYTISYGVISMYGMHGFFLEEKKKVIIAALSLAIFLGLYVYSHGALLYDAKYPPTLYYVSYGIFWSMFLSVIGNRIHLNEKGYGIIRWISINSMNIYMWHMIFYYLINDGVVTLANGMPRYIFILTGAVICTLVAQKSKEYLEKKRWM